MNRVEEIQQVLQKSISDGEYGPSGSPFLTVREFVKQFKLSSRDAMRIYDTLRKEGFLRLLGGSYYVSSGFCLLGTALRKALDRKKKSIFGVLVNNVSNPFFSSVIRQLQTIASAHAIQLIISDGCGVLQQERDIMDMFLELGCRGVFNCASLSFRQQQYFARYPLPLVNIAEDIRLPNADVVLVDNEAAGKRVAKHLIECRCHSFCYLALEDCVDADPRFDGYYKQLLDNGFELPRVNIGVISNVDGNVDEAAVRSFVTDILRRAAKKTDLLPLGIFCHHDMLAVEVLRSIKSFSHTHGGIFAVPKDIQIVGFDDLPIASAVSPTITTMAYLYSDIAKTAFNCMMAYEKTPSYRPGVYEVRASLVARESTASLR